MKFNIFDHYNIFDIYAKAAVQFGLPGIKTGDQDEIYLQNGKEIDNNFFYVCSGCGDILDQHTSNGPTGRPLSEKDIYWCYYNDLTEVSEVGNFDEAELDKIEYLLKHFDILIERQSEDVLNEISAAFQSYLNTYYPGETGNPLTNPVFRSFLSKEKKKLYSAKIADIFLPTFYSFIDKLNYATYERYSGEEAEKIGEIKMALKAITEILRANFVGGYPGANVANVYTTYKDNFITTYGYVCSEVKPRINKILEIGLKDTFSAKRQHKSKLIKKLQPACYDCVFNDKMVDLVCSIPGCNVTGNIKQFVENSQADTLNVFLCTEHGIKCDGCGKGINKDDSLSGPENEDYCQDCSDEKCGTCEKCDSTCYVEDLKNDLCSDCGHNCDDCEERVQETSSTIYETNICESCAEDYSSCYECNLSARHEDTKYVESEDIWLCEACYSNAFSDCQECGEAVRTSDAEEDDEGNYYHKKCYDVGVKEPEYKKYEALNEVSYNKKERFLHQLKKLLPISIIELKQKHKRLADGLADLIKSTGGKDLTPELVEKYESKQSNQNFKLEYSTWKGMQRSVNRLSREEAKQQGINKNQLVINVIASDQIISELNRFDMYKTFDEINTYSKESSHPYKKDQICWVRIEIDPKEEYFLIDEIQSDHMNAYNEMKTVLEGKDTYRHRAKTIVENLVKKYGEESAKERIDQYRRLVVNEFAGVAMAAINKFAKEFDFKIIYSHEYETGKELKQNHPPQSLYTKLPQEHFFSLKEHPEKSGPFGLGRKFFERLATYNYLLGND